MDSAASARRAALFVTEDSRRFSRASHGIAIAAKIKTTIPMGLGVGSL